MSTTCEINLPSLDEVQAMPLADIGRHIARLNREHDFVIKEEQAPGNAKPGCLSDEMGDALYEISWEALGRSPKTIADAAVLLLAVSQEFSDPIARPRLPRVADGRLACDGACHQVYRQGSQVRSGRSWIQLLDQQHQRAGLQACRRVVGGTVPAGRGHLHPQ